MTTMLLNEETILLAYGVFAVVWYMFQTHKMHNVIKKLVEKIEKLLKKQDDLVRLMKVILKEQIGMTDKEIEKIFPSDEDEDDSIV